MKSKLKAFIKSLSRLGIKILPWSISRILFDALLDRHSRDALPELARRYNIVALKARGDYGILQSTAWDTVLLPIYGSTGQWSTRINNLFKDFFAQRGGGTYIDVGANIGATTIPVAQDPRVTCLAIEPEPVNYANLVTNIAANCPHGNVETLQFAIFSRPSMLQLELNDKNMGDHRLRRLSEAPSQPHAEGQATVSVTAVPLDDIAPQQEGALGIKVDTQGAEPFIFEGGPKTLARAQLIVLEFCPYDMARMGANPESIITVLEKHFNLGSVAEEEWRRGIPPGQPMAIVASELRQLFEVKRGDPNWYADVIASK